MEDAMAIDVYLQLEVLQWGAHGHSNNGNNFYVVE